MEAMTDVIEILYADADLVRSFSSQIRGGLENSSQRTREQQKNVEIDTGRGGPLEFSASLGPLGASTAIPLSSLTQIDS